MAILRDIVLDTLNNIAQEPLSANNLYQIKDFPSGGITNAQMAAALTPAQEAFYQPGDVYMCTDNGTYTQKHFYKFTKTDTIVSWEDVTNNVWEAGSGDKSVQTIGTNCAAIGDYSSSEGYATMAKANYSHTEGFTTKTASDDEHDARYAHAENYMTEATGLASHAEGDTTYTQNIAEHAQGRGNKSHKDSDSFGSAGNTIHSIGIAQNNQNITTFKNALEIMQNGDQYILGVGGYDGKNISTATTLQTVISNTTSSIDLKQNITDSTLATTNKTIPTAINEVNSIAKGAQQAVSYNNYQAMITAFNSLASDVYLVGQNIMIITLDVPDLWISGVETTSQTYTYTTDAAVISALQTTGYIQVGYYKLSALETGKVDLTSYYTKSQTDTLLNDKQDTLIPGTGFTITNNTLNYDVDEIASVAYVDAVESMLTTNKQDKITVNQKLNSDLVSDWGQTNKFVTAQDKENWNAKQGAITSSNKLSADLIQDGTTNKVFTSTDKTKLDGIDLTNLATKSEILTITSTQLADGSYSITIS